MLAASSLILGWVAVGYPGLMALLSIVRPKPHRPDRSHLPEVAVIVPACTEAESIDARLDNLLRLSPSPRWIIVVTDGSTDDTEDVAKMRDDPRVVVLGARKRGGKLAALRRGLQALEGRLDPDDVVVFTDANTAFADDAIGRLVPHFADPCVGSVGAARRIAGGRALHSWLHAYESRLLAWETRVGSAIGAAGELLAIRFGLAGTLCARLHHGTVNEDFALAMGVVGARLRHVFDSGLLATEPISIRRREELVRRTRISAGRALDLFRLFREPWIRRRPWVAAQVVSHKGLRLLIPVAILPVISATIAAIDPSHRLLYGSCAVAACVLSAARRHRRELRVHAEMTGDSCIPSAPHLRSIGERPKPPKCPPKTGG